MVWCRPPIMWAPPGTGTAVDPMMSLKFFSTKLEAKHPDVWACNIAAGYSFADTPDTGCSISVVTTLSDEAAREHLLPGANLAWSQRERGTIVYPPVDQVVSGLKPEDFTKGPVVLVEPSDNIGGGAPGDGTGILRSLLKHKVDRALVIINDPAAVAALQDAAPGAVKSLAVGGRGSPLDAGPVSVEATFVSRSDGNFTLEDPNSHLASMNGLHIAMGPCAVVKTQGITILLTSRKTAPFDLGQLRSQGIEPTEYRVIGVKAAVAHKRAYDKISRTSYYVDTPGPCTSNLHSLPWKQLVRPIYPLDANVNGQPKFS
jgi:microcystin degradation protein MlrC